MEKYHENCVLNNRKFTKQVSICIMIRYMQSNNLKLCETSDIFDGDKKKTFSVMIFVILSIYQSQTAKSCAERDKINKETLNILNLLYLRTVTKEKKIV